VAVKKADCAKRMIVWCTLALVLVTVFLMAGYALFEGAGQAPTVQPERRPQALPAR
jgi:hypothetical protein